MLVFLEPLQNTAPDQILPVLRIEQVNVPEVKRLLVRRVEADDLIADIGASQQ